MTARAAAAVFALLAVAVLISFAASLGHRDALPRSGPGAGETAGAPGTPAFEEARERARAFPFYRSLFVRGAVRRASLGDAGTIRLSVDLRAACRSSLRRAGLQALDDALPSTSTVEVGATGSEVSETWRFLCPEGCLLDVFAAEGPEPRTPGAASAVRGDPDAVAVFRLAPERFRDLAVGPKAQRVLRERVALVEAILGRPVRGPAAEDLAGTGSAAAYRGPDGGSERALVAIDLVRSDRVRGLLDIVLGLGALTRGAAIRRHRDIPIGALAGRRGGLAAAVDGNLLFLATDPAGIENAIDRRRDPAPSPAAVPALPLLRGASLRLRGVDGLDAVLTRVSGAWRLESRGPTALADDAVVSGWLRGVGGAGREATTERSGSGDRGP